MAGTVSDEGGIFTLRAQVAVSADNAVGHAARDTHMDSSGKYKVSTCAKF